MEVIRRATDPGDWQQATALLHDYAEWIRAAVGIDPLVEQPAFADELCDLAGPYGGDAGFLFIAYDGELAVGTIAVRFHDDGAAELKRMYVRPIARGRGMADRLVRRVLDDASDRGCHSIWLESLPGVMDPAVALYRRHGFVDRGDVARTIHVDGIVVMERVLAAGRCRSA